MQAAVGTYWLNAAAPWFLIISYEKLILDYISFVPLIEGLVLASKCPA